MIHQLFQYMTFHSYPQLHFLRSSASVPSSSATLQPCLSSSLKPYSLYLVLNLYSMKSTNPNTAYQPYFVICHMFPSCRDSDQTKAANRMLKVSNYGSVGILFVSVHPKQMKMHRKQVDSVPSLSVRSAKSGGLLNEYWFAWAW